MNTWEKREELLAKIKDMWHEEYLFSLREECRDLHKTDFYNKINVSDIILVKNPAKSRSRRILDRVVELICGSNQKFRSEWIKRGDGSVEIHSLSHLYPLELSLTHNYFPDTSADEGNIVNSKDCRNANSKELTNKVASMRFKRKKISTWEPEYRILYKINLQ